MKERTIIDPQFVVYRSIFAHGAEIPLGVFTHDGIIEAIAGLLSKRVLAVKLREDGVAVVFQRENKNE